MQTKKPTKLACEQALLGVGDGRGKEEANTKLYFLVHCVNKRRLVPQVSNLIIQNKWPCCVNTMARVYKIVYNMDTNSVCYFSVDANPS